MSPMAQKRTSRLRLVPIQPMVPINSLKGPPANDVNGPLRIALDQNSDQCL
jgi:hypothetical protein